MNMDQRRYHCPALPLGGCDWQGAAEDLPFHFEVSHQRLRVHKAMFHNRYDQAYINGLISVQEGNEENQLLIYSEDTFVLQLKVDLEDEKLWVGIRLVGNPENSVKFQYHMLIDSENGSIKSQQTGVVQLDDDWSFDIQLMLEFDLKLLIRTAIKHIYYSLRICDPEKRTCFDLSELRCMACQSNCAPRAFACEKGHIVCIRCKRAYNRCGHVEAEVCSLVVENINRLIGYTCKNKRFGCNVVLPKSKIRFHEGICFALTSCFADNGCQFMGTAYNWWYHLLEKHPETMSIFHQDHWYDIRETHCPTLFIRSGIALFRILTERKHADEPFLWSFQQLGLKPGDEPLYELEVATPDPKTPKSKVIGRVSCCSLIQPEDEASEHYIAPSDILQPFIVVDNKICIRFYLRRIEK